MIRLPFGMLITTAFDFPGYETVAVQGEIFGLTVRARNIGSGCAAGLRSIFGGEIPQFTKLLAQSRNEAMARMIEEARMRGSNAIVAMRFDSGAIGQWSEICAYGTGVWVKPLSDVAKEQYDALVAAGQLPHQDTYQLRVSELQRTEPSCGSRAERVEGRMSSSEAMKTDPSATNGSCGMPSWGPDHAACSCDTLSGVMTVSAGLYPVWLGP